MPWLETVPSLQSISADCLIRLTGYRWMPDGAAVTTPQRALVV